MTITVKYWRGTTQMVGHAKTYRGAMRLADRNQNAYGPTFHAADGERLHDTGYGLVRESKVDSDPIECEILGGPRIATGGH